jgi:hypothetical protein
MTHIMLQVRDIYQQKGNRPIQVQELLNSINKRDITRTSKEELVQVLHYYKKLQVLYINNDE